MAFRSARRDAWLIIGAKSTSWLGDLLAEVALVLRLQGHGAGAGAVSALLIANLLPVLALSPVAGRLLDRYDNRRLLLGSSLTQLAVCSVLAFVSPTWAVLGLVALLGAGQSINGAAWQALLPAAVDAERLPWATGRMYAAMTIAGLVATPLSGLLTGWYGARIPLLVDAATFGAVTAAALLIHTRRGAAASAAPVPEAEERPRGGLAIVRHDRLLRPVFVLLAVFILLASMVNVVEVFLVRETLDASAMWYGIAGGAYGLGAFVGALLGGRLRGTQSLARGFVVAAVVLSAGLASMGTVPAVAWLLPCGFAAGIGNGILNVTLASLVMGRARDAERGRVGAVLAGVASGTQLTAFAIAGALVGPLTPRELFIAVGLLGLLVPLAFGRALLRAAAPECDRNSQLGPAAASPTACCSGAKKGQADFSRRSRLGASRGTRVG